jgi:2-polyprenyl-3-methyl-5-hydroxy-6-metoxy-1,4-benzoquinol methylase
MNDKNMKAHNQASAWFNDLYSEHKDNHDKIPWAKLEVNPLLKSYLNETEVHQGKALVIGCGLGDDARALELAGYDVLAIDVSEKALELAGERFPDSKIIFEKQDIFDMPKKYHEHFDFVFEAFTIQSLPVEFRENMIKAVADTIAPNGKLLLVAHKKKLTLSGPPWPLKKDEVDLFKNHLTEVIFELHPSKTLFALEQFRVLYQRE